MPIELPNLDDRSFADLVEEGKRLIPAVAPSWTDHNPSDPGITFIELFASVTEMLMYRVNRISDANKRAFIKLLAPDWKPTPGRTIDQEISAAVKGVRQEDRAVTVEDFERLALEVTGVERAHCLPRRNLKSRGENAATTEALGHLTLIIVCAPGLDAAKVAEVIANVENDFRKPKDSEQQRYLITTLLHVVEPVKLVVKVNLTLYIAADQLKKVVEERALDALDKFFDPLEGGLDGKGWPFGGPIYRSDIYALMDQVEGVDYVDLSSAADDLVVVGPPSAGDRKIMSDQNYIGLRLEGNELVGFARDKSKIDCKPPQTNIP